MPKRIPLQAIKNFRDVGGYSCAYGETSYGILYRAAAIDKASKEDVDHLAQLGIKTVIDLRDKQTSLQRPDATIDDTRFNNILINIDVGSKMIINPQLMQSLMQNPSLGQLLQQSGGSFENVSNMYRSLGNEDAKKTLKVLMESGFNFGLDEMVSMYLSIACDLQNARKIYQTILYEPKPVLIHCTAGKDRTGIFVALLLLLNGVALEDVNADYLASYPYLFGKDNMINDDFSDFIFFKPNLTLIPKVIMAIEEQFGSIADYFAALDFDKEEIDSLSLLLK